MQAFHFSEDEHSLSLRKVLEDPCVVKYACDCRKDSDALFHQFGVRLRGVTDLQVAEVALRRCATRTPHTHATHAHHTCVPCPMHAQASRILPCASRAARVFLLRLHVGRASCRGTAPGGGPAARLKPISRPRRSVMHVHVHAAAVLMHAVGAG